ncbi:MAG TPA: hypothetical protein VGQ06_00655 [Gemmatimonadales bacterium]|jgi:hypothetical protein|nr:hypothetical protein [Gemmatimonadales bacterium]
MPVWAKIQILLGAALGAGALTVATWRRRPTLELAAELVSATCCAVLLLAYWDIRLNAALGGFVIPLFAYVVLRESGHVLRALRVEAATPVSPAAPLPQAVRVTIEAARGILLVVPAIYLGGILTYRIWYLPPLDDSLTHGIETVPALYAALQPIMPRGSSASAAQDSLQRYGFACMSEVPSASPLRNTFRHTNCNKHVRATDSTLLLWQVSLAHRHDSLLVLRINVSVMERR